jgi:hypothetical protein
MELLTTYDHADPRMGMHCRNMRYSANLAVVDSKRRPDLHTSAVDGQRPWRRWNLTRPCLNGVFTLHRRIRDTGSLKATFGPCRITCQAHRGRGHGLLGLEFALAQAPGAGRAE